MEIVTDINWEKRLRTHRVRGVVTPEGLIEGLKKIYEVPGSCDGMNVLWDIREADLSSFQTKEVHGIRDFVSRHWGGSAESRAALVVSRDADYWLSRLYAILSEGPVKGEIRIFRDLEGAMEWVGG